MTHLPVNHRLQPWYRLLAGLTGLYVLAFGVIGIFRTAADPPFQHGTDTVFGLHLNLAFAILSVAAGLVIVLAAVRGGNVDHFVNLVGGCLFLGAGIVMLLLLQTDSDFLNFRMATCVMSFIIGIVLLTAGLYGRVGEPEVDALEEAFRMHGGYDPITHRWAFHGAPPRPAEDDPDGHRFA